MPSDLLRRRATHFVLWRPAITAPPPRLVIGKLQPGNPPDFDERLRCDLQAAPEHPELWQIAAADCQLEDGIYHYWFEVNDSNPYHGQPRRLLCTDPTACTVDWRLLAPAVPGLGEDDRDPAAVVALHNGRLQPCDPGGESVDWNGDPSLDTLPTNNQLVIYELPTAWSRLEELEAGVAISVGTFRDVVELIEPQPPRSPFSGVPVFEQGKGHLRALGVNALELLPPADSFVDREWGYATSNYFAADYDLGFPKRHASPTASVDLAALVKTCHRNGMRFFTDVVMAFATRGPYQNVNFLDFHVQADAGDPEEFDLGRRRDGFGGDLFKYNFHTHGYDPVTGARIDMVPARQLMQTHLARWMDDFRIDGIRIDSVENIVSWDFVAEFKNHARDLWGMRWQAQGLTGSGEARFLVVGEELAVPIALIDQQRLDGLWNEEFKRMLRQVLLGRNGGREPSFEWTVRKMIDCRLLGFGDGSQTVNYVTSHDVGGFANERLFNYLHNNEVPDIARRIRLAFACLLTAVGVPMIFAGEEFADRHDLPPIHPQKQVDPVNFDRLGDDWRQALFRYVSRLVRLRTSHVALARNDTDFIHVDFNDGKRVLVWVRGQPPGADLVVVVANFSDYGTPQPERPDAEYRIPNWPAADAGRHWREVTQERDVPTAWAGREPIYPWEAKVYALV